VTLEPRVAGIEPWSICMPLIEPWFIGCVLPGAGWLIPGIEP
jgi:hypothetical protein